MRCFVLSTGTPRFPKCDLRNKKFKLEGAPHRALMYASACDFPASTSWHYCTYVSIWRTLARTALLRSRLRFTLLCLRHSMVRLDAATAVRFAHNTPYPHAHKTSRKYARPTKTPCHSLQVLSPLPPLASKTTQSLIADFARLTFHRTSLFSVCSTST